MTAIHDSLISYAVTAMTGVVAFVSDTDPVVLISLLFATIRLCYDSVRFYHYLVDRREE